MSDLKMGRYQGRKGLRLRIIGEEDQIIGFIDQLENHYNIRLYPDPPKKDTLYGGVRVYVEVPYCQEWESS